VTASEAGPRVLKKDDAYLVMRMALGLLPEEQIEERKELDRLAAKKAKAKSDHERLGGFLKTAEAYMRKSLLERGEDVSRIPEAGFFAPDVIRIAEKNIAGLRALQGDITEDQQVRAATEASREADAVHAGFEKEIASLEAQRDALGETIERLKKESSEDFLTALGSARWECKYYATEEAAKESGCPGLTSEGLTPEHADRRRNKNIEDLQANADAITVALAEKDRELAGAAEDKADRRAALERTLNEQARARDGVSARIGEWKRIREAAIGHGQHFDAYVQAEERINSLDREAEARRNDLAKMRKQIEGELQTLTDCYRQVLRWMEVTEADGVVRVDLSGVRPVLGDHATSGTTIRSCGTVLAYDMGCLLASIAGLGHLPRFWVHDSPRAADTEEQLYLRVLSTAGHLQELFGDSEPTFQHIWTTTSQPPEHLNCEPYVRLRLHGRDAQGKLLRQNLG